MTKLSVVRDVSSPFSATIALIEQFHEQTDHRVGPHARLQATVECATAQTRDYTDTSRIHEAIVLQWRTHGVFPIPRLRGLITVRPKAPGTELRIEGSYVPPLGFAGRFFDALIGRHIAKKTLERFADSIQAFIDRKRRAARP
jgi:hypothetical protein